MADPSSRARVALPRIPPWTAPTPAAVAKAAEAQKRREEGKGKDASAAATQNSSSSAVAPASAAVGVNGSAAEKKVNAADLAALVGARIRVTNILGRAFTGTVYSSAAGELVLSTGATEYHIIPVSKIRSYEALGKEVSAEQAAARERESQKQKQMAEEREKKLARPPGVSTVGHALFLVLEKTLPVRWNDKKIVVLDNVTIEPPYDADDCKAPAKHTKQLERVRELVRREREKVAGRRGG